MIQNGDRQGMQGNVSFACLKEARVIYINGPIDDGMAYQFNTALLGFEYENPREDITVYINSPGGSVSSGLSMIDTMDLISCDVSTVCVGMAASMGAMLLMSGTKGKRRILPHSEVLIHQTLSTLSGTMQTTDLKNLADNAVRMREMLYDLISEATGQPLAKIEVDCERDYVMNAKEALDYGIVDEIVTSRKNR
ncbi:MAG: ATP-dependent Clp protease proteolytic subunit [Clostridia bacterium]|nr:ATP-dependent Clp protease proteolytic subunit [Clostridia bacterium]MBQ3939301.1 ATP-dependent Clp protease proteolytic subunit [Clostridia bacterium]